MSYELLFLGCCSVESCSECRIFSAEKLIVKVGQNLCFVVYREGLLPLYWEFGESLEFGKMLIVGLHPKMEVNLSSLSFLSFSNLS